jgi:hypothetical protein
MTIKDRIKEFRRVKASSLVPNPLNWRTHPKAQAEAMNGMLAEIGYADALLARETPEGLMLIDGHLRATLTPDTEVPVLVVDLTEDEANKLLALHDPIAAMAETNEDALKELMRGVEADEKALQDLLGNMGKDIIDDDGDEGGGIIDDDIGEDTKTEKNKLVFMLTEAQLARVRQALEVAKQAGEFKDTGNDDEDGNALWRLADAYLFQAAQNAGTHRI